MRTGSIALLCAALLLVGCGDESPTGAPPPPADPAAAGDATSPRPPPGSMPEAERAAGELVVTIDGETWRTRDRVRSTGFTPSAERIDQTLKGAVAGMESTMTDPKDLWFIVQVEAVEPGTWPLVRYTNQLGDQEGAQAWIEIGASEGVGLPGLTPDSGRLTLETVTLAADGQSRVTGMAGSFAGTFFGPEGEPHEVSGEFDFTHR